MSNIVDFKTPEKSGYITNNEGEIVGVYTENIQSNKSYDDYVFLNYCDRSEITVDEMNTFCIMWLCIHSPNCIKEDE